MKRLVAPLLIASIFSPAMAQTSTFVCGGVSCTPFAPSGGGVTGIDDLSVRGVLYDVTFTNTLTSSPFAFSYDASSGNGPLTGVDAGNALQAFFATQGDGNPGDEGPIWSFVTAYQVEANGQFDLDVIQPSLGQSFPPVSVAADIGDNTSAGASVAVTHYTGPGALQGVTDSYQQIMWSKVSAPSAAPELQTSSLAAALTVLIGGIVVYRGKRPKLSRTAA